jgi:S-adenosylmethionine synthetase
VLDRHLFTSESVTEGHPDKVADQISDAILDAILTDDPTARVACETLVTTGLACVAGEITTTTYVPIGDIVRRTIERIGYTDATYGFDSKTCAVVNTIGRQSPDIKQGVDTGGAGDQGMMFGYASDETDELMPLPILLAHKLTRQLAECRRNGAGDILRPDGKSQVTVVYEGDIPVAVDTVVVSTQHDDKVSNRKLHQMVISDVIEPVIPKELRARTSSITSTQRAVRSRRTAGRRRPHGPKDHRRYLRRNGTPWRRCIQRKRSIEGGSQRVLRRSMGCEEHRRCQARSPVRSAACLRNRSREAGIGCGRHVRNEHGSRDCDHARGGEGVRSHACGIIKDLDLRQPIYEKTAAYGHFGRNSEKNGRKGTFFTWERTDRVKELIKAVKS